MADPVVWAVVGRIVERAIIAVGGILALWFGFRLFALTTEEKSTGQLEWGGLKFTAVRVGPGVFFAMFGALLLGYSLFSQVEVTSKIKQPQAGNDQPGAESSIDNFTQYSGLFPSPEGEIPNFLKAANTLIGIAERSGTGAEKIAGMDFKRFLKAAPMLNEVQRRYVDRRFGMGTYDKMIEIKDHCARKTRACNDFASNADQYTTIMDIIATRLE